MKGKNAFFLLQAIGELSEETVAEAKRPVIRPLRRIAAAAAAAVIVGVIAVIFVLAGNRGGQQTPTEIIPSEQADYENITLETAVETAKRKLSESGITATLDDAYLTSDGGREYYLIKFTAEKGRYNCSVDAQSGEVTDIVETETANDGTQTTRPEETAVPPEDKDGKDQNKTADSVSVEYLSGTIRTVKEEVGDICEVGGLLYSEYWCDSGWRDFHTVALITSQAQLDQFFLDFTGDTQKGYSFSHSGLNQYDWENYGMIAVANTREDNIALDLTELRKDESSASFYPYFRASAVISNEPLSNITDIKLYRIRLTECEGVRGFYL